MIGPADSSGRASERIKTEAFLLFLALVLGAVLRFSQLVQESFWYDEAWSVQTAHSQSLRALLETVGRDVHPPLYFAMLREWVSLFGDSEGAVRSLSAVFGVLVPLTVYALGRVLSLGGWASLLGAFLYALNTQAIWYSQEARMYSLLSLLGTLHLTFAALLLRPRCSRRQSSWAAAAWWVTGALCLYSHFFGLFFLAAGGVAIGWRARILSRPRGRRPARDASRRAAARALLVRLAFACLGWAVVAVPLLLLMVSRLRTGSGIDWLAEAKLGWGTPWKVLEGLAVGEQLVCGPWLLREATKTIFVLVALVPLLAMARGRNRRFGTALPLLVALILAGTPTLISLFRPIIMHGTRYVSVAGAPLCLAFGTGAAWLLRKGWSSRGLATAAVALVVASDAIYLSEYYLFREKPMWREAVGLVASKDPSSPMAAYPDHMTVVLRYYDRDRRPLIGASHFFSHREDYRRVWLLAEGIPTVTMEPPWTVRSSALVSQSFSRTSVSVFLLERVEPPAGGAVRAGGP